MGDAGRGIEVRETSIRITFRLDGRAHKKTVKTGGAPIPPTPANIKYALRLAEEIKAKIKFGTFVMAEYFDDDGDTGSVVTVEQRLRLWLKLQTGLAPSTRRAYGFISEWWIAELGSKPIASLVHSDILGALANASHRTGKTVNNTVSVLRNALKLSIRDGVIKTSPLEGLEASSHQNPEPDPFTDDEREAILQDLGRRFDPQIENYFGVKFFTGVRTGESLAIRPEHIDMTSGILQVRESIVLGEHLNRTKTKKARNIFLNSRAKEYISRQLEIIKSQDDGWLFHHPEHKRRWDDDKAPRSTYWEPTLKRLGIRPRNPYQTRHTYATMMLMAGMTPAFGAKQMGHSIQMFLRTYARWIDGDQNALEMRKLEAKLSGNISGNK